MLNNINTAALFVITIIKFEIYYLSLNIIVLEIIKVIKNVINSVISLVISKILFLTLLYPARHHYLKENKILNY